jgi:hypothetical protein
MTIYRVQGPDGKVHKFEGPEGASPAEVEAAAAAQFGGKRPAGTGEDLSGENALTRGGMGFAKPIVETVYGARSLLKKALGQDPALTPMQQKVLDTVNQPLGTAGNVGQLGGNVAMLAAPGGAVSRLPRAIARLGADVGLNAAAGGLQAAGQGKDALEGAAWGAAGAGLGAGLGAGAGKAVAAGKNALTLRPGARELIDAGVPLTPGQAVNGVVQATENMLSNIPLVGTGIRKLQKQAAEKWNSKVLKDTAERSVPGFGHSGDVGQEGFAQLKSGIDAAYDGVWKNSEEHVAPVIEAWGKSDNPLLARAYGQIKNSNDFGQAVKDQRLFLKNQAKLAEKRGDMVTADHVRGAIADLERALPEEQAGWLKSLDAGYGDYKAIERAAGGVKAAERGGVFTPRELLAGSKASARSKAAMGTGEAPLQQEAMRAQDVLGIAPTDLISQLKSWGTGGLAAVTHLPGTLAAAGVVRAASTEPVRKVIVEKLLMKQPLTPKEIEAAVRLGIYGGGAVQRQ